MLQVLALLVRYHAAIMFVIQTIEAAIPDGTTVSGPQKLDIALKRLIAIDATLESKVPQLTQAIAFAKSIYNDVRAIAAAPAGA